MKSNLIKILIISLSVSCVVCQDGGFFDFFDDIFSFDLFDENYTIMDSLEKLEKLEKSEHKEKEKSENLEIQMMEKLNIESLEKANFMQGQKTLLLNGISRPYNPKACVAVLHGVHRCTLRSQCKAVGPGARCRDGICYCLIPKNGR